MKLVIIGRTATGKHHLAAKLQEHGFTVATAYTTNPDTPVGVGYPIIQTQQDADLVDDKNKFRLQSPDGTETYMLFDDLKAADVIILHPEDLTNLGGELPDESLQIIHLVCKNAIEQDNMEQKYPKSYIHSLKERQIEESPAYSTWEQRLAAKDTFGMAQMITIKLENDYQEKTMDDFIQGLLYNINIRQNMMDILEESIAMGLLSTDNNGRILVQYSQPTPYTKAVSLDIFYDLLVNDPTHFMLVMTNWLAYAHDVTAGNKAWQSNMDTVCAGDMSDTDTIEPDDETMPATEDTSVKIGEM